MVFADGSSECGRKNCANRYECDDVTQLLAGRNRYCWERRLCFPASSDPHHLRIFPSLMDLIRYATDEMLVAPSLKIFCAEGEETAALRVGRRLDKYRLLRRLGEGGFATVFSAHDLIEDRKVALKIPDERYITNSQSLEDMQREVRIMARLDHPCVLPLKDARFIDGHFVIVFPLGAESLADRLSRRISRATAIDYVVQMTSAVAYAHENKVLHPPRN